MHAGALKKEERDDAHLDLDEEDAAPAPNLGQLRFDPIDSRHLSSLTIVKDRLEKLLRNSPHNMHSAQNILVTIVRTTRSLFTCYAMRTMTDLSGCI